METEHRTEFFGSGSGYWLNLPTPTSSTYDCNTGHHRRSMIPIHEPVPATTYLPRLLQREPPPPATAMLGSQHPYSSLTRWLSTQPSVAVGALLPCPLNLPSLLDFPAIFLPSSMSKDDGFLVPDTPLLKSADATRRKEQICEPTCSNCVEVYLPRFARAIPNVSADVVPRRVPGVARPLKCLRSYLFSTFS